MSAVARYGPDIPTEAELRLLGDIRGRRVLELGCGSGEACVAFARQGAVITGVDSSAERLAGARQLCEREEVRVELRQSDLADLAFVRADSIDAVFAAYTLSHVADMNRVFRQVHRVLKVGAPLVFSLPHPAGAMFAGGTPVDGGTQRDAGMDSISVDRSYWQSDPLGPGLGTLAEGGHPRTLSDLYMALVRASYRVDSIVEPEPVRTAAGSLEWRRIFGYVPRTLIVRARKEGN